VSTWRLKTGTFRLGEATPTKNLGPLGWGLSTRLTALSCKNFVVASLQLEKPRIDERRRPVRRNARTRGSSWVSKDGWRWEAEDRKSWKRLIEEARVRFGL
jgi:hypothetical protein